MFKNIAKKGFSSSNQIPKAVQDFMDMPVSVKVKNHFKSNNDLLNSVKLPYELRGEYLPRRKINPYKKKPLTVEYNQSSYMGFVLPSKRKAVHGIFDQEELFGIKKWRNDSPLIKEYIRVDNQICIFLGIFTLLSLCWAMDKAVLRKELNRNVLMSNMGVFSANDLV